MVARAARREFTVADEYRYNQSGAVRWILSHLLRYKPFVASFILGAILANVCNAAIPTLTGSAFTAVLHGPSARSRLGWLALAILGAALARGLCDVIASFSTEFLGKRVERDAREELYISLLGKSQIYLDKCPNV